MNQKKPFPLNPSPLRKRCPVCGEVSYSQGGMHPQCAVQLADSRRMKSVKPPAKSRKPAPKKPVVKAWHKLCPACSGQVHLRRTTCDCGHVFRGTRSGAAVD